MIIIIDNGIVYFLEVPYMPPEQENGLPLYSNCDLYALGMTAIQALTGIYPDNIDKNPQTNKIVWSSEIEVNQKLRQILDNMVDDDFRERYQSADEILQDLSQNQSVNKGIRNLSLRTSILHYNNITKLSFIASAVVIGIIFFKIDQIVSTLKNINIVIPI